MKDEGSDVVAVLVGLYLISTIAHLYYLRRAEMMSLGLDER